MMCVTMCDSPSSSSSSSCFRRRVNFAFPSLHPRLVTLPSNHLGFPAHSCPTLSIHPASLFCYGYTYHHHHHHHRHQTHLISVPAPHGFCFISPCFPLTTLSHCKSLQLLAILLLPALSTGGSIIFCMSTDGYGWATAMAKCM